MGKTTEIRALKLDIGELYLFHATDPHCPPDSSIWGIFDRDHEGIIYTESTSCDLLTFQYNTSLPADYRYSRCATRSELRDYIFNLSWFESTARGQVKSLANMCRKTPNKVCRKVSNGVCEDRINLKK